MASAYPRVRDDAGPRTRVRGSSNSHSWNWNPTDSVMEDGRWRCTRCTPQRPQPSMPRQGLGAAVLSGRQARAFHVSSREHTGRSASGVRCSRLEELRPLQPRTTPRGSPRCSLLRRHQHTHMSAAAPAASMKSPQLPGTPMRVPVPCDTSQCNPKSKSDPPRRRLVKGARWHAPLTTHAHVVKHVLADQKRPYHGMMNGCTVPTGT